MGRRLTRLFRSILLDSRQWMLMVSPRQGNRADRALRATSNLHDQPSIDEQGKAGSCIWKVEPLADKAYTPNEVISAV